MSPAGQQVLEKYYYGSGAKDYGFKKWRPERGLTTDQYEKELESNLDSGGNEITAGIPGENAKGKKL